MTKLIDQIVKDRTESESIGQSPNYLPNTEKNGEVTAATLDAPSEWDRFRKTADLKQGKKIELCEIDPTVSFAAFTATATQTLQQCLIQKQLQCKNPAVVCEASLIASCESFDFDALAALHNA